MIKVLKPYTIIPSDLYVEREADRQIENIIGDMGRPGYVLVSRQMGKTNLLINAKRRLETSDDLYLYIDLSNPFDSAKSCFENIIDIALEVDETRFDQAKDIIEKRRKEQKILPPHKQHTNELRVLLNAIKGKLVIILDEIDALTKTTYSDLIFAQIRSIYFLRVNYPELSKLTYILSGVIEPIEIIKDPKISPFNIGQKIYLNDFDRSEFDNFTRIAKLNLTVEISDRIFFWAKGNPRMTWDICSEYEVLSQNNLPSTHLVDKIVRELYLTTFDKPPIDNIRELVKNDRDIRNAIVEIIYGKGKEVSDKIKSKLYLSGIINFLEKNVTIKNEILKEALNIEWIKEIESEDKGLIRIALEFYEKGNFKECILAFEEYLKNEDVDDDEMSTMYFYFGEAYYRDNQLDMALLYLEKAELDVDDQAKLFYRRLNLKGTILYKLNRIPESLEALKQIIDSGRKDIEFAQALLNYGVTLIESPDPNQLDEAIKIFEGIINESALKNDKLKKDYIIRLKAISYKNIARIQLLQGNKNEAKVNFENSLSITAIDEQPSILLFLYEIEEDKLEKARIIQRALDIVRINSIVPSKIESESSNIFSFNEFRKLIFYAFSYYGKDKYAEIIEIVNSVNEENAAATIFDILFSFVPGNNDPEAFRSSVALLFSLIKENKISSDKETEYTVTKFYAYVDLQRYSNDSLNHYYRLFMELGLNSFDSIDLFLFESKIKELFSQMNYKDALSDLRFLDSHRSSIEDPDLRAHWFIFNNIELSIYNSIGKAKEAHAVASDIIQMSNVDLILKHGENKFGRGAIGIVLENAKYTLKSEVTGTTKRQYERNEKVRIRYKSGEEKVVKYKLVERDLDLGNCIVIYQRK